MPPKKQPTPSPLNDFSVASEVKTSSPLLVLNERAHTIALAQSMRNQGQFADAAEALARVPNATASILLQRAQDLAAAHRYAEVDSFLKPMLTEIIAAKRQIAAGELPEEAAARPLFNVIADAGNTDVSPFEANVRLQLATAMFLQDPRSEILPILKPLLDLSSHRDEAAQLSMVALLQAGDPKKALLVPYKNDGFSAVAPLRAVANLSLAMLADDSAGIMRALADIPHMQIMDKNDGLIAVDLSAHMPRVSPHLTCVRVAENDMPMMVRLGEGLFHAKHYRAAVALFGSYNDVMDKAIAGEAVKELDRSALSGADHSINTTPQAERRAMQAVFNQKNKKRTADFREIDAQGFGKLTAFETKTLKRALFSMGYVYHHHAEALRDQGQIGQAQASDERAFKYLLHAYKMGVQDSRLFSTLTGIANASPQRDMQDALSQCMYARDQRLQEARRAKAAARAQKEGLKSVPRDRPISPKTLNRGSRLADQPERRPHRPAPMQARSVR